MDVSLVGFGFWLFWSSFVWVSRCGWSGWLRGLVGLLFEICIVDASIWHTTLRCKHFRVLGLWVWCCLEQFVW